MNLAYKILSSKLKSGELVAGQQIGIQIDQTLTQDSTGTMAYLQLEAMGIEHVAVEKAVAYIDHNMLQTGFENMDDHEFIRSVAKKHGITFSKPGNGVCHQLQLENFAKPGKTLVGSDSHTPTCGAMGMIAIGAGGLDVAVAMATGTYYLQCPSVVRVNLVGKKAKWASAKDVILYILQQLSVKGGVNKIIEYTGEGLKELSLTDRATICNMGAELGATTSVFPTDEITKEYLIQQGREEDYVELKADEDATYDKEITVDLSKLVPLTAKPHSPDAVVPVSELRGMKINQVVIGSCTNSSLPDMLKAAKILKGRRVATHVSLVIAPGSSSILAMLSKCGAHALRNVRICYQIYAPAIIGGVLIVGITSNLSSAIIIFGIGAIMIIIAGADKKFALSLVALGGLFLVVILIAGAAMGKGFRFSRIMVWLNPEEYADSGGYQVMQGLYAIGSGGLFGKGLGNSAQKLGFVPEATNDMIFSIICEELGIFGAICIILLFIFMIRRMRVVACNAPNLFGSMIVIGVMAQISMQVVLNIAVVTNSMPNTGVSLPFISYGGTSLVFLMAEMGLVFSVSKSVKKIR